MVNIPHVPEYEKAILGTLILGSDDQSLPHLIKSLVPPGSFYTPKHEKIYNAILELIGEGDPVDLISVSTKLDQMGMNDIGGTYYLTTLMEAAVTVHSIEHYCHTVVEYATRRAAYFSLLKSAERFIDVTEPIQESFEGTHRELFTINTHTKVNSSVRVDDGIEDAYTYLRSIDGIEGGLTGIGTGYNELDRMTGGWKNGNLIILAARPSMGKSALAFNMMRNAWVKHGKKVAAFSFEMPVRDIAGRILTAEARVDAKRASSGRLTQEEWVKMDEARARLKGMSSIIDDNYEGSLSYVLAKTRQWKEEEGIDGLIVDYLQLMTVGENKRINNREQEISTISRELKKLALTLDIPIIALSQLSRNCETRSDKRPMLSDLRESGAIEQDADIVSFIYRDERYGIEIDEEGNSTEGIAEIIFGKQRGGPVGTVKLAFVDKYVRFENLTSDHIVSRNIHGTGVDVTGQNGYHDTEQQTFSW